MKLRNLAVISATVAILLSCGGSGNMKFGDNEFPIATVEPSSASMQTTYPATIKGVQDVEIRPKISGFITKICVQEGQSVRAGQLLFVIDNATYQAQVRQARAAVNTASAQVNTAQLTYNNSKQLFEKNVIGSYEFQTSKNTLESAKAQLAQAQAALVSAQETLGFCYVKSPANGVVGSIPFKVGALVSASSMEPMTTVSDISFVEVYFSIPERDMLELTRNAGGSNAAVSSFPPVKLQLADGTMFNQEGAVTKASGVIDAQTGSVSMIAKFANPQKLLKSGGSGSIIIPRTATNSIIVPQECVVEVQDKHFIYIVGKDNKVKYTEIQVSPQNDGKHYVVTSGLKMGDKYVTNGITKLTDKMEIKPITPQQYQKKIDEATKLGAAQDDAKKLKEAFK